MLFLRAIQQNANAAASVIESAVRDLGQIGVLGALMEIGLERNKPRATTHPLETNSARAAWMDGYSEALRDLVNFRERYLAQNAAPPRPADFGAGEKLLAQGDLEPEEFKELYGRTPPAGLIPPRKPTPTRSRTESA